MIRIQYAYKENDILNDFIDRQISEANLEGYSFAKWSIDFNPMLVEFRDITHHHTLLILDKNNDELIRIDGPFDSKRVEDAIYHAKGILANRIKQGKVKI